MPKYIIRVFSNFASSVHCKEVYERLCEAHTMENYGKDKEIYLTADNDYTHAIIMNSTMPRLNGISKDNVVGLAFEPPHFLGLTTPFISYAQQYIGKYFIGEKYGLPAPFIEYHGFMWHNPPLKTIPTEKPRIMSIMVSHKQETPGHKYRHAIVQKILESNLPIDIYGKGCRFYKNDSRIKGEFSELEPYLEYQFHIAIENLCINHYYSEKIINSLLSGTTPVYLGCKNIDSYFPNMVIKLSQDLEKDMQLLRDIVNNPETYRKPIDVDSVKNTTNLLRNVKRIFHSS